MSYITGSVPISGFIAPIDSSDNYPVIDSLYGIDGLRNVKTLTDLYNIPLQRRRGGMVVGVPTMSTTIYYKLSNGPTWSLDSSDWNIIPTSYGAGLTANGNTVSVTVGSQSGLNISGSGQLMSSTSHILMLKGTSVNTGSNWNGTNNNGSTGSGEVRNLPIQTIIYTDSNYYTVTPDDTTDNYDPYGSGTLINFSTNGKYFITADLDIASGGDLAITFEIFSIIQTGKNTGTKQTLEGHFYTFANPPSALNLFTNITLNVVVNIDDTWTTGGNPKKLGISATNGYTSNMALGGNKLTIIKLT